MASLAYAESYICPAGDLLRANYVRLLDTYHEACLHHLELGGIEAASIRSRHLYRQCKQAREAWVRHCKEHGCKALNDRVDALGASCRLTW
jgi:hypothetical protein